MKKRFVGILAALLVIAFAATAVAGALRVYHGYAKRLGSSCPVAIQDARRASLVKPLNQCRIARGTVLGKRTERTTTRITSDGSCMAEAWSSVKCGF